MLADGGETGTAGGCGLSSLCINKSKINPLNIKRVLQILTVS